MKIIIEVDDKLNEPEIVIRCSQIDEDVTSIQSKLLDLGKKHRKIEFYKADAEYYLALEDILFFETSDEEVWAHTKDDEFQVKYKLYELLEMLPGNFLRVSKSTILNSNKVYSILRNLTASSKIEFNDSNKVVYVSRSYFKSLKEKLALNVGGKRE